VALQLSVGATVNGFGLGTFGAVAGGVELPPEPPPPQADSVKLMASVMPRWIKLCLVEKLNFMCIPKNHVLNDAANHCATPR
jgi:hypothetical protein